MNRKSWRLLIAAGVLSAPGCAAHGSSPLSTVRHVDLQRFMGTWYVIANIPTWLEKNAYAATETYCLSPDGTVQTTFVFRKGSFGGPERKFNPIGFVLDRQSNAIWGMRFIWLIKADYRIAYLAPDYSTTIIAREKRDYVWIMARTPHIDQGVQRQLIDHAVSLGYERQRIQEVPQR